MQSSAALLYRLYQHQAQEVERRSRNAWTIQPEGRRRRRRHHRWGR
jgi:hypothetical protein